MRAAIMAAALVLVPIGAGADAIAAEPVVLTITGDGVSANRPDFDSFDDAFFAFSDKEFTKAHALTADDLRGLAQVEITAAAEGWPKQVTARGPRLSDVLTRAGVADGDTINLVALDGYAVTLDPVERKLRDWILAIEVDGTPLGLGGRGPAWLLYESGESPVDSDGEAQWVWSVYLIAVE